MNYTCDKCDFKTDSVARIGAHKRWQHRKRKKVADTSKNPDIDINITSKRRTMRQLMSQHIPRPENFDISGCGIELYYDHLTFIPDLDDPSITVEYLDKERVCKKCRKRYNIDKLLAKRKRQ